MQNHEIDTIERLVVSCRETAVKMAQEFALRGVQRNQKPDTTFVTEADLEIERTLRAMIKSAFPDHFILGEEEGGAPLGGDTVASGSVTWIIDPIDGTFSFMNGIPFYSSLLAVLIDGVPVLGSATLPELGWVLHGRLGRGATFNGKLIDPLKASDPKRLRSDILAIADPYRFRMSGFSDTVDELLSDPFKTRVYPDALGYMLLVTGAVNGFVDPKTEVWDVAPFHVILPEAGFTIRKWDGSVSLTRGAVYSRAASSADDAVTSILRKART
jgi:histidinol-phosphatase